MTGLQVGILKHGGTSCDGSANFSSRLDEVMLLGSDGPFEISENTSAVMIVERMIFGKPYLTAYPVINGKPDTSRMFGGCFIYTSDGRFPATYPVPLHDRTE